MFWKKWSNIDWDEFGTIFRYEVAPALLGLVAAVVIFLAAGAAFVVACGGHLN